MNIEIFVDTSGWMAILNDDDLAHESAQDWLTQMSPLNFSMITTDYIIDETVTLFRSRRYSYLIAPFFKKIFSGNPVQIEWINENRFFQARDFLFKHEDKDYSFTDCTSFVVMRELRLTQALASDRHFKQAGFKPLLC
ncbi:MAG: PIN domain-containing protein [Verrucomicrobiae bacterium]|nr:PIN domain-containing protein [Verrucomicrobiae bacterium]